VAQREFLSDQKKHKNKYDDNPDHRGDLF
jgi:hypothetical protein